MISIKKYLFLIGVVFIPAIHSFAQKRDISKHSDEMKHEVAHRLIEMGGYYAAIDILKELVAKDTTNKKYIFKLAEAYYKARDYKNAEILYPKLNEKTTKGRTNFVSIGSFHYAECLKYNGKYEQARVAFQLFSTSNYKDLKGQNLKQLAKNEIKSCEYALAKKTSDVDVAIGLMGDNINSAYSDFAPSLKDDNTLTFSSYKSDSVITVDFGDHHHDDHVKIFESDFDNGAWGEAKEIKNLTPYIGHAANGSFSPDGKKFYFTRCKNKKNGKVICNIYVCPVDTFNTIGKPKKLKNGINHNIFTSTQPVVGRRITKAKNAKSKPTTEDVLYFASDMKGTYGGMDIWYASFDKDGNLKSPANCGKTINSVRDEVTPYYDLDAGVLYFSSNYLPGFGGFDVFKAKGWTSKWQKPENLKLPVNSPHDDTYFTLLPENKLKGFIVSNREGSTPLTHSTCCEDIWSLDFKIPTILVINAIDSTTSQMVRDAITVQSGKFDSNDSLFTESAIDYDTNDTNTDAHFLKVIGAQEKIEEYYIVGANKKVTIIANKQGYNFAKVVFDTDSLSLPRNISPRVGTSTAEIRKNVLKLSLFLAPGNKRDPDIEKAEQKGEKKDTVKTASSLKQEFSKVSDGPNVDVFVGDTMAKKKVIQEIDITFQLSFEYKQIALNERNLLTLDSLVYVMRKKPRVNFEIGTHTDGIGSEQYNMDLSIKRASFVANYMIKKGIIRSRIVAKGYGETRPLVQETYPDGSDYPDARQANRRTEIRMFE